MFFKLRIIGLVTAALLFSVSGYCQEKYYSNADKADSFFKAHDYYTAIKFYQSAFRNGYPSPIDEYRLAKAYANIGSSRKALKHVKRLFTNKYRDIVDVITDTSFIKFSSEAKWSKFLDQLNHLNSKFTQPKDSSLIELLAKLAKKDSYDRIVLDSLYRNGEKNDSLLNYYQKNVETNDSINIGILSELIDSLGWLSEDKVGRDGVVNAFFVIQHATLANQEKYFSAICRSVKEGTTPIYLFAYFLDRILSGKGKKQIYGTQFGFNNNTNKHEALPIKNLGKVNDRRRKAGLLTLEQMEEIANQ